MADCRKNELSSSVCSINIDKKPRFCTMDIGVMQGSNFSRHFPSNNESSNNFALISKTGDTNSSTIWKVKNDSLRRIPSHYPIEKSHITVYGVTPSAVATRIVNCLRKLSIAAVFDDWQATAMAETMNHVYFTIRLFKPVENLEGANTEVIVELQRIKGDSICFHNTCREIFKTAKGNKRESHNKISLKSSSFRPLINVKGKKYSLRKEDDDDKILFSLETINGLLKKDRIDANLLGIESLRKLTNPSLTNRRASVFAAKTVLLANNKCSDIKNIMMSLLKNWKMYEDEFEKSRDDFEDHFSIMHNHALAVLANSLDVLVAEEEELEEMLRNESWLSGEKFISLLILDLNDSVNKPHNAYQAARSLNALVRLSPEACVRAVELGAPKALRFSYYIGQSSHELLAGESKRLLAVLV